MISQICGHWSLPSEHLSNMWSLVIAIRTPTMYLPFITLVWLTDIKCGITGNP